MDEKKETRVATPEERRIMRSIQSRFEADGRSQKQIADETGITPGSITEYAGRGKRKGIPSLANAEKLADCFGISIDELIGHETDPSIKTLNDLLSAIFAINEVLPLKYENGSLSFDSPIIDKYLQEWSDINNASFDEPLKTKMMTIWKNDVIANTSDKQARLEWKSVDQCADELCIRCIKEMRLNDPFMPRTEENPLNPKEEFSRLAGDFLRWTNANCQTVPDDVMKALRERVDVSDEELEKAREILTQCGQLR